MNNVILITTEELLQRENDLRNSILAEVKKMLSTTNSNRMEYLTAKEVEAQFHISATTLWRHEQNGLLMPHRSGKKRLYSVADIEKFLRK